MVRVGNRAHRRIALAVNKPLFARVEAHNDVALIATDVLSVGTGRTRDLPAGARLHLDIVHDGADRHRGQRHGIAGLHVDLGASDHLIADALTPTAVDNEKFRRKANALPSQHECRCSCARRVER